MAFDKFKEEWSDMDPKFRWVLIATVAVGALVIGYRAMQPDKPPAVDPTRSSPMVGADGTVLDPNRVRVLPDTPRNQGIEDLSLQVARLTERLLRAEKAHGGGPFGGNAGNWEGGEAPPLPSAVAVAASAAAAASAARSAPPASRAGVLPPLDLGSTLPPNFDAPGTRSASNGVPGQGSKLGGIGGGTDSNPVEPAPAHMKIWAAEAAAGASLADTIGGPVVPAYSALESVMLSGINARPSGSIGGAVGSVNSANNVGAPFVTRIKGEAIMPNGWKLDDLGDCFLGGSGIAILSTERAYVIADNLSCIAANGEVYEAPIKAYGLDVDGTLGIAGKVVSKQGSLLLQAALTGMASGLGAALSPSTLPAYNSNASSGQTTGVQYPNPAAIAQTAVGQGINQAAGQLSKFYLDYAKEVFPVVEVTSGTRVTWILTESVELKRSVKRMALK